MILLTLTLLAAQPSFEQPNPRLVPEYDRTDPPRRWIEWPQKASIIHGAVGLLFAALFLLPSDYGRCDFLCFRDEIRTAGIASAVTGGFLLVSGVVMAIIVMRHNQDLPPDDG